MTPYNVISKMFGPYTFSATARETLGDKMELYFHDHSFMPLFVQVMHPAVCVPTCCVLILY